MNEQNDEAKTTQPAQADDMRIERQLEEIKNTLAGHTTTLALIDNKVNTATNKVGDVCKKLDKDPQLRRKVVYTLLTLLTIIVLAILYSANPSFGNVISALLSAISFWGN